LQIRDICSDIRANDTDFSYCYYESWDEVLIFGFFWIDFHIEINRKQNSFPPNDCLLRQYFLFVVNSHEIIGYSFECKNSCLLKMLAILKAAKHPINLNLNWRSIECVHKWDLSTDSRHPLVAQLNGRSFECLILWIIKLFFIFVLY
jgi:hypothetical protein